MVIAPGHGSLTRAGKRRIADAWYLKGKAFIAAALLLRQMDSSEHTEYVVLHLICQGIEILMKGLLLLKDYDGNVSRLKPRIGHNLVEAVAATSTAYGLKPMRPDVGTEIAGLNDLYSKHWLRYGSVHDIFIDPRTIPRAKVIHRLRAAIRLAERHLLRPRATASGYV
jgi:hypothetical protein